MMPAKLATLGHLKIKVFRNKDCDTMVSVHDVTKKILSLDSNFIIDVVISPKFGNSSYHNLNFKQIYQTNQIC